MNRIGTILIIFGVLSTLMWGVTQVQHTTEIGSITVGVKGVTGLLFGLIPLVVGYGILKSSRK